MPIKKFTDLAGFEPKTLHLPVDAFILWSSLNRQELWGFSVSACKGNPSSAILITHTHCTCTASSSASAFYHFMMQTGCFFWDFGLDLGSSWSWTISRGQNLKKFPCLVMISYRLITAYLLLRVNLDKIMHAAEILMHQVHKPEGWVIGQASKLTCTASALFCVNSWAQK